MALSLDMTRQILVSTSAYRAEREKHSIFLHDYAKKHNYSSDFFFILVYKTGNHTILSLLGIRFVLQGMQGLFL